MTTHILNTSHSLTGVCLLCRITNMPTAKKTLTSLLVIIVGSISVCAQAVPEPAAYKLTAMNIVPYKQSTGSFLPEIKNDREYWSLNELDLSLFVTIEVTGSKGSYSP